MKARIENGVIKVYGDVPCDHKNILNFRMAEKEIHKQHGFYDVVKPAFDGNKQKLGSLKFDVETEVFKYEILQLSEIEAQHLAEQKQQQETTHTRRDVLERLLIELIKLHHKELPAELIQLWESEHKTK